MRTAEPPVYLGGEDLRHPGFDRDLDLYGQKTWQKTMYFDKNMPCTSAYAVRKCTAYAKR